MNYVILNGVKSTTIQGLLIQSLPPISKPLLRTNIEEIDGRDGDIVTSLGYSAYDKEMSIGLFGDYNVDEVIHYFNSEGTVIFSNEPDKFYYYKIIEQIDLERLINFKTATVTFHVQPFKFSAVDDTISVSKNQMNIRIYSATRQGVAISSRNEQISIVGQATDTTEFYVPINAMILEPIEYTLKATTTGTGANAVQIRVISSLPQDSDSFGHTSVQLDDGTVTLESTPETEKTFNYIWVRIEKGVAIDLSFNVEVLNENLNSFKMLNRGNTIARPTITIYGNGAVDLMINGVKLFTLNISEYMTINAVQMNAYKGDTLMNRAVTGDYADLILNIGTNTISWTGDVSKVEVEEGSRWI